MGSECRQRCRRPRQSLMDNTVEIFDDFSNVYVGTECETNFHGHQVGFQDKKAENFTHVVDLDNYEFHKIIVYDFLGRILQSVSFRAFILILVLVNAVLIGLQTVESHEAQYGTMFVLVDHIILSIFIFEIALKWAHDFRMFWVVNWNIMDFLIVLLIVGSELQSDISTANSKAIIMVRVVRAFRSLRSVSSLSSLAIVTHTIFKSIGDMMSILFVLMIFMVVAAVMGVTLFDLDEITAYTSTFNSPFEACFLLFVCITQDGWVDFMERWRGKEYFGLLMIYIIIAIAIGAFIFSNLIIAVVVANLEMGVAEIRAEKLASMNPLSYYDKGCSQTVEVNPTYMIFSENSLPLRGQRPCKVPSLKHINARRLHAYIHAVVALEQNMLEHTLIQKDLEKVMGVVVSIVKQFETFEPDSVPEDRRKGLQALKALQNIGSMPMPIDAFERATLLDDIKNAKKH